MRAGTAALPMATEVSSRASNLEDFTFAVKCPLVAGGFRPTLHLYEHSLQRLIARVLDGMHCRRPPIDLAGLAFGLIGLAVRGCGGCFRIGEHDLHVVRVAVHLVLFSWFEEIAKHAYLLILEQHLGRGARERRRVRRTRRSGGMWILRLYQNSLD